LRNPGSSAAQQLALTMRDRTYESDYLARGRNRQMQCVTEPRLRRSAVLALSAWNLCAQEAPFLRRIYHYPRKLCVGFRRNADDRESGYHNRPAAISVLWGQGFGPAAGLPAGSDRSSRRGVCVKYGLSLNPGRSHKLGNVARITHANFGQQIIAPKNRTSALCGPAAAFESGHGGSAERGVFGS